MRDALDAPRQARRLGALMRFDIAGDDVHAALFGGVRGLEHGVGLAHARGVPEEDLEMPSASAALLCVGVLFERSEQKVGSSNLLSHANLCRISAEVFCVLNYFSH